MLLAILKALSIIPCRLPRLVLVAVIFICQVVAAQASLDAPPGSSGGALPWGYDDGDGAEGQANEFLGDTAAGVALSLATSVAAQVVSSISASSSSSLSSPPRERNTDRAAEDNSRLPVATHQQLASTPRGKRRKKEKTNDYCDCCQQQKSCHNWFKGTAVPVEWRLCAGIANGTFTRGLARGNLVLCEVCLCAVPKDLIATLGAILVTSPPQMNTATEGLRIPNLKEKLGAIRTLWGYCKEAGPGALTALLSSVVPSHGWDFLPVVVGGDVTVLPGVGPSGHYKLISVNRSTEPTTVTVTEGSGAGFQTIGVPLTRIYRPAAAGTARSETAAQSQEAETIRQRVRVRQERDGLTSAITEAEAARSEAAGSARRSLALEGAQEKHKFDLTEARDAMRLKREEYEILMEKKDLEVETILKAQKEAHVYALASLAAEQEKALAVVEAGHAKELKSMKATHAKTLVASEAAHNAASADNDRQLEEEKKKVSAQSKGRQRAEQKLQALQDPPSSSVSRPWVLRNGKHADDTSNDSSSSVSSLSPLRCIKPVCGEVLRNHIPMSEAHGDVAAIGKEDDGAIIRSLCQNLVAASEEVGSLALVSLVESLFPSTYASVAGKSANAQLRHFSSQLISGEVDSKQPWPVLWGFVPPAVALFICEATTGAAEQQKRLGSQRCLLLLNQSISLVSILCHMVSPRCTQITQQAVSLLLMSGKSGGKEASALFTNLGVATSLSASARYQIELVHEGRKVVIALIRKALELGLPIFIIFDNADWNRLVEVALHLIHYIAWFGDKAQEGDEFPQRKNLCDLHASDFAATPAEIEAARASDEKRDREAEALVLDTANEVEVKRLTVDDDIVRIDFERDRAKKRLHKLGRPVKEEKMCDAPPTEGTPLDPLSGRMQLAMSAISSELEGLKNDSSTNAVVIQRRYIAESSERGANEAGPLTLYEGDVVKVVAEFPDRNLNIAAVRLERRSALAGPDDCRPGFGYVPRDCLTGDPEDAPPSDRAGMLTTPLGQQDSRFISRWEAIVNGVFQDDDDDDNDNAAEVGCEDLATIFDESDDDDVDEDFCPTSERLVGRPIDRDRIIMKEFANVVSACGGACPENYHSTVPLTTSDGKVTNLEDWRKGELKCKAMIFEAAAGLKNRDGSKLEPVIIDVTDNQEHKMHHDDQDNRRAKCQKTIDSLKRTLPMAEGSLDPSVSRNIDAQITDLTDRRNSIDEETAHGWGIFHGSMGSIRGYANSHGTLALRGMLEWAGFGSVYEKVASCSNGYYALAIELLKCCSAAYRAEGLVLYEKFATGSMDDQEPKLSASSKLDSLASRSQTCRLYNRALRVEVAKVLDLHLALQSRGNKSRILLGSALKGIMGVFVMGGNHNLQHSVGRELRLLMTARQPELEAMLANPTVTNRAKQTSMAADQGMENYGIRVLKRFLNNPHPTTALEKSELLKAMDGIVRALIASTRGDQEIAVEFGGHRGRLRDEGAVVNRMRAGLRRWMVPTATTELSGGEAQPVPIVVGPGKQQVVQVVDPEYISRFEEVRNSRVEECISYCIRAEIGGSGGASLKSRRFGTLSVEKKTRSSAQRRLRSDNGRLIAAVGLLAKKGDTGLSGPHGALKPCGSLYHTDKSKSRVAYRLLASSAFDWENGGTAIGAGGSLLENTLTRRGSLGVVIIHGCIRDANRDVYRVWPFTLSTKNQTGVGQCMAIVEQFCGADLNKGIEESILMFDAGGCEQKMVEEEARDKRKRNLAAEKPRAFVQGDLGKRTPTYFGGVFGDRKEGGGRQQVLGVMGGALDSLTHGPSLDPSLLARIQKVLARCPLGSPRISVGGSGRTAAERGQTVSICTNTDGTLNVKKTLSTHHLEDTGMVFVAVDQFALKNRNCVISSDDADLWKIAMIALARLKTEEPGRELGEIFVQMKKHTREDGSEETYINCGEGVECLLANSHLCHISNPSLRVLTLTTISEALGGDVTHSIRGISQITGTAAALEHLQYIGNLVRIATAQELEDGWPIIIDAGAYERLTMVLYATRDPTVVCDGWKAKSVEERGRLLDELTYPGLEKAMALRKVPDVTQFMLSAKNLSYARGRVQCRTTTWYNASKGTAAVHPLVGFNVTLHSGTVVSEPLKGSIQPKDILCVSPKFTTDERGLPSNTSFVELFGPGGITAAMLSRALQQAQHSAGRKTRKCGSCLHEAHGKSMCGVCQEHPCIARCSRCGHPPHKGETCALCPPRTDKRSNCVEHCLDCNHPGNKQVHHNSGCALCQQGEGCQARAALVTAAATAAAATAAAATDADAPVAVTENVPQTEGFSPSMAAAAAAAAADFGALDSENDDGEDDDDDDDDDGEYEYDDDSNGAGGREGGRTNPLYNVLVSLTGKEVDEAVHLASGAADDGALRALISV